MCYLDEPKKNDLVGSDNFDNGDSRSLAELGRDYNGLMVAIESELCAVEGLDGLQSQARKGRATGAHFCWTTAMGDDTAGAAKTTSVSRAWRRTAKWLGGHLKDQAGAEGRIHSVEGAFLSPSSA